MMFKFSGIAKRNISLIIIILLTAVFYGSIDLSYDSLSYGGGIKGRSGVSASHSLIAFPSMTVRGNYNGSNGNDQNLEKGSGIYNILSGLAKKLLTIIVLGLTQGTLSLLKHYYILICIAGCTCLFLLTHVRFIHLKDGSK